MARIKKGDLVVVIAGSDKGKQGRVLTVDRERERIVVEGVNHIKRHRKVGQSSGARTGGIETVEGSIHISNVQIVEPENKRGTRVGIRVEEVERDGRTRTERVRVAKRSGKDI